MFYNASVAQVSFETNITDTLTLFASTVVETIITTIFHLTSISSPITNTCTRTIDALAVAIFFVTVAWTFWCAAINASPRRETFGCIVVVQHTMSWADVFGIARRSSPSIVTFTFWIFFTWIQKTFTMLIAGWMGQTDKSATINTTKTGHARARAVLAFTRT